MSILRDIKPTGVVSINNTTTTPLGIGATYTGTGELNDYTGCFITVSANQNGVLYAEFSQDGTNWDTSLSFNYDTTRINPPHQFEKGSRYFRVRFENTSGVAQTHLRIQTSYGTFGKLTSPINGLLSENFDATVVRPTEYRLEVAMGKRQGRKTWNKFGFNQDVDTAAPEVISSFGGTFNIMTTADFLSVVSTSANDTSAGTGARTILIEGIGADFLYKSEIITMNGTSNVSTPSTFLGVNRATVLSSGSLTYNAGDITITDFAGTVGIQAEIPTERSVTQQCILHTQINHKFLADWIQLNVLKLSGGGGSPVVTIRGYSFSRITLTRYEVLEIKIDTLIDNTIGFTTPQPFVIGGREVLYFTAETDVNNTAVSARFSGIEEREI